MNRIYLIPILYFFLLLSVSCSRQSDATPSTQPAISIPSPVVCTQTPVVFTPTPVVFTPLPVIPTSIPIISTPTPVVPTPSPVISTPSPMPTACVTIQIEDQIIMKFDSFPIIYENEFYIEPEFIDNKLYDNAFNKNTVLEKIVINGNPYCHIIDACRSLGYTVDYFPQNNKILITNDLSGNEVSLYERYRLSGLFTEFFAYPDYDYAKDERARINGYYVPNAPQEVVDTYIWNMKNESYLVLNEYASLANEAPFVIRRNTRPMMGMSGTYESRDFFCRIFVSYTNKGYYPYVRKQIYDLISIAYPGHTDEVYSLFVATIKQELYEYGRNTAGTRGLRYYCDREVEISSDLSSSYVQLFLSPKGQDRSFDKPDLTNSERYVLSGRSALAAHGDGISKSFLDEYGLANEKVYIPPLGEKESP